MAEPGKSGEEPVFEKPPYLTAAQAIAAGDTAALQYLRIKNFTQIGGGQVSVR